MDSVLETKTAAFNSAFKGYAGNAFCIRLWDGWRWFSSTNEKPVCTIVIRTPPALASLMVRPDEVTLGEAFVHGGLDVEGDLFSVFQIAEYLLACTRAARQKMIQKLARASFELKQFLRNGFLNSKRRDRASIAYHYDLPVAFYEPWLGKSLVYSCAFFQSPDVQLDTAQVDKLDLVCRKLRLQPCDRFLDIGCGWGSLVMHAGAKWRAHAEGITLSREQAAVGKRRIAERGLADRCSVRMLDYREIAGSPAMYDKIASIGMFEHVGLKNLPLYFRTAFRLLRPGGLMLNHGIARCATAPLRAESFVQRYVFPDGRLVTLSEAVRAAESQGFEIRDVENLREHYELTLRHWVSGLEENRSALLQLVPETTYRTWLLYTAGSAAAFRRGDIAVHQVLLSRSDQGRSGLPLTRDDVLQTRPRPPQRVGCRGTPNLPQAPAFSDT